ncbi:MAG: hypothetical protein JRH20_11630 [Deltaproteobacteria bacterium]|nr:hypothetical protein [Deltaproteobacteria bacterium]
MFWPLVLGTATVCAIAVLVCWLIYRQKIAKELRVVGDLHEVESYLLKRLHEQDPRTRQALSRRDVNPASVAARLRDLVTELTPREQAQEELVNADTIEVSGQKS